MQKSFRNVDMSEIGFLKKKEEMSLKFFRQCIAKTNQFSAKYVLEKMLKKHQEHIDALQGDLQLVSEDLCGREDLAKFEYSFSIEKLCEDFDLSTLTFVEAIKIAIRITEKDIASYKQFLDGNLKSDSKEALKRILSAKSDYIKFLEKEQARVS